MAWGANPRLNECRRFTARTAAPEARQIHSLGREPQERACQQEESREAAADIACGCDEEYPTWVWYCPSVTEVEMAVDEQVRQRALRRLSIIEGQLKGVRRMIEGGAGCVDILTQISAVHEALRGVGKVVVRHHIETCVTDGLQTDDRKRYQDELMDLMYKLSK